jgi:hypothetical protein
LEKFQTRNIADSTTEVEYIAASEVAKEAVLIRKFVSEFVSEYIAASEVAKEAIWIRKFVSELGIVPSASSPMDLYYDNSGAIAQAKESRSHEKSKHILRRYHLIREIIDRGDAKICKVHMDLNIADPLMKALS